MRWIRNPYYHESDSQHWTERYSSREIFFSKIAQMNSGKRNLPQYTPYISAMRLRGRELNKKSCVQQKSIEKRVLADMSLVFSLNSFSLSFSTGISYKVRAKYIQLYIFFLSVSLCLFTSLPLYLSISLCLSLTLSVSLFLSYFLSLG